MEVVFRLSLKIAEEAIETYIYEEETCIEYFTVIDILKSIS
jgi:hypothetical protein